MLAQDVIRQGMEC